MFDTFDFMAFNWCCILGGPYYPTLPYVYVCVHEYACRDLGCECNVVIAMCPQHYWESTFLCCHSVMTTKKQCYDNVILFTGRFHRGH